MKKTVSSQCKKQMRKMMASKNKKRKAKNSYLTNGFDKHDGKWKRNAYFTKRQRNKNKKGAKDDDQTI